ncbi:MAG: hypothetical protein IKH04_03595 [Kiritimatiellae bacterium]|nr:hypothetical protein [Kiritimatiellia bacterium]
MVASAAHLGFAMPRLTATGLPAMVTVVVSDEDGHPVSEAEVSATFVLFGESGAKIETGKWLPWNQEVQITLVENRAKFSSRKKQKEISIMSSQCYGFDLEKGILFPFSAATDLTADFFLTAIPGDAYTPRQRILFGVRLFSTNDCNGITVVRQHSSSIYP